MKGPTSTAPNTIINAQSHAKTENHIYHTYNPAYLDRQAILAIQASGYLIANSQDGVDDCSSPSTHASSNVSVEASRPVSPSLGPGCLKDQILEEKIHVCKVPKLQMPSSSKILQRRQLIFATIQLSIVSLL